MALTKINFYLSVLMVVLFFAVGLQLTGVRLLNSPLANLDQESSDYIGSYSGITSSTGMSTIYNTPSGTTQKHNLLGSGNNTNPAGSTDFLAVFNFKRDKLSGFVGTIKTVWNVPSFLLLTAGLDVGEFTPYINTFSVIIEIALIVLFLKLMGLG